MSKQFELTRHALLKFVNELDEKIVDVQPEGFNNTIHWHIGHVLVSAEKFMFGYPQQQTDLPSSYHDLFTIGSKPADWTGEIPSVSQLAADLESQQEKINALTPEFFTQKLPFQFPFGNIETFGDLYALMLYHEAEHLGLMKAMKKFLS